MPFNISFLLFENLHSVGGLRGTQKRQVTVTITSVWNQAMLQTSELEAHDIGLEIWCQQHGATTLTAREPEVVWKITSWVTLLGQPGLLTSLRATTFCWDTCTQTTNAHLTSWISVSGIKLESLINVFWEQLQSISDKEYCEVLHATPLSVKFWDWVCKKYKIQPHN
jgi:Zn finger protein HypA/HybF involved in hydrogenase expression